MTKVMEGRRLGILAAVRTLVCYVWRARSKVLLWDVDCELGYPLPGQGLHVEGGVLAEDIGRTIRGVEMWDCAVYPSAGNWSPWVSILTLLAFPAQPSASPVS